MNVQKNRIAINLLRRSNLRDDLFAYGNFKVKILMELITRKLVMCICSLGEGSGDMSS